jgi:hypothetical protein
MVMLPTYSAGTVVMFFREVKFSLREYRRIHTVLVSTRARAVASPVYTRRTRSAVSRTLVASV